jgi:diguanylate cyclase (GGDEF)-like protein
MLLDPIKPLKMNYRQELFALCCVNIVCFLVFSNYDTLEWLYLFSRSHEHYELDEFVPLFFSLTVTFALFSFRRWKEAQLFYAEVEYLSFHDSMTGLLNRRGAQLKMAHLSEDYAESAVIFIDFDNFKQINQLYGYEVGDEILKRTSHELLKGYKQNLLSRWAGEELVMIAPNISRQMLPSFVDELYKKIKSTIDLPSHSLTMSIGAVWGDAQADHQQLLVLVDEALSHAKHNGGAQVKIFEHNML